LDSAPDGIVVFAQGRVLYVNRAMAAIVRLDDPAVLLGLDVLPLIAPEWREFAQGIFDREFEAETYESTYDIELLRPDGSRVTVEANGVLIRFQGELASLVFVRDRTERQTAESERLALEEQLFQAQKMESVGLLAGGIAHDYNNILTVQQGYCELMRAQMQRGDPLSKNLEEIETSIERAASLTRQLLAFSRKQQLNPVILDLNDLVSDLAGMLHRLIGEDVRLVIRKASSSALVVADAGQVEQALVNLSVNARDAMPRGGVLEIEVSVVDADRIRKQRPRGSEDIPGGRYAMLRVSDTGHGMVSEVQRKVFEPFFTTKGTGKGTGLGLSTVYGAISQLSGQIWLESEVGRGTTFWIILPSAEQQAADQIPVGVKPVAHKKSKPARNVGELTVLVVEDEPAVRGLVASMLERLGHQVVRAASGEEAVAFVRGKGLEPNIILTDLVLPDVNGRVLAERLHETVPEAKVIYMSGYADDAILGEGFARPGVTLLHKPFTVARLSAVVKEAVGG
jgi:two-component system cell cycle sensor histidine kinase/response regulator CckA